MIKYSEIKKVAKEKFGNGKYLTDKEDGFRQGAEWVLEQIKKCSIPAVVGQSEQFYCTCSRAKGLDYDEDGMPYCIECQKPVQ